MTSYKIKKDFSNEYDKLWKAELYKKMIDLKVPNCLVKWIKSFLTNRMAQVKVEKATSKQVPMKEGLTQGSILAPILWVIYINDIDKLQLPLGQVLKKQQRSPNTCSIT